jgi:hypothetical protein
MPEMWGDQAIRPPFGVCSGHSRSRTDVRAQLGAGGINERCSRDQRLSYHELNRRVSLNYRWPPLKRLTFD